MAKLPVIAEIDLAFGADCFKNNILNCLIIIDNFNIWLPESPISWTFTFNYSLMKKNSGDDHFNLDE
jgi:hypothetical protein